MPTIFEALREREKNLVKIKEIIASEGFDSNQTNPFDPRQAGWFPDLEWFDPDQTDWFEYHDTPLHGLAKMSHWPASVEVAESLVAKGADVNLPNEEGCTPVYLASFFNNVEMVRFLVSKKADPNKANKEGLTPLYGAAGSFNVEVAKILVDGGADPHKKISISLLDIAFNHQDMKFMSFLFSMKPDVNQLNNILRRASRYRVMRGPEWYCLRNQRFALDMLKLLLENGADPNSVDWLQRTPLHWAAMDDFLPRVALLVEYGADLNPVDIAGDTPLHWVIEYSPNDVIAKFLIEHGADCGIANSAGKTPFDLASKQMREFMLMKEGFDRLIGRKRDIISEKLMLFGYRWAKEAEAQERGAIVPYQGRQKPKLTC